MKLLYLFFIFPYILLANEPRLSNIPLPKIIFINLETLPCDYECLQTNLMDGNIFTFLTRYQNPDNDEELLDIHRDILANFKQEQISFSQNADSMDIDTNETFRVAILVPSKKIGRYSKTIPSSVLAYLQTNVENYELKVFDSIDENITNIQIQIDKIQKENFKLVIAPYTLKGVNFIANMQNELLFFIPTINKDSVNFQSNNMIFGGINYHQQIDKLSQVIQNDSPVSIMSDSHAISKQLNSYIYSSFDSIKNIKIISGTKENFKYVFHKSDDFNKSNIFINASVINTSLFLSQLRVYEFIPSNILSTQTAYNKLLFKLTQNADRTNFYVANSIGYIDDKLEDMANFLHVPTKYNWVHYSTLNGLDYLYSRYFKENGIRSFEEEIIDNQIEYNINILQAKKGKFNKVIMIEQLNENNPLEEEK